MWQKIHCDNLKLREVWHFPVRDSSRRDRKELLFSLYVSHYSLTSLPQANILHIDSEKSELQLQYNVLFRYAVLLQLLS